MATLTIEVPDELMTELNVHQVSSKFIDVLVAQTIEAWLRRVSTIPSGQDSHPATFVKALIAENQELFEQVAQDLEQDTQPPEEADRLGQMEQMEQAANDPLFMADLHEVMSAFTEVDAEWWEQPE